MAGLASLAANGLAAVQDLMEEAAKDLLEKYTKGTKRKR
jgi:hypothetical protein